MLTDFFLSFSCASKDFRGIVEEEDVPMKLKFMAMNDLTKEEKVNY